MSYKLNLEKLEKHLKPEWTVLDIKKIENDLDNIIDKKTSKELNVHLRMKEALRFQVAYREKSPEYGIRFILEPIIVRINKLRKKEGLKKSKNWKIVKKILST